MTREQLEELKRLEEKATKADCGMSEQGRTGILWTLFADGPYGKRIASFSSREDALAYKELINAAKQILSLAEDGIRWREMVKRVPDAFTKEEAEKLDEFILALQESNKR